MAAAAGIWNHQPSTGHLLSGTVAKPMAGPAGGTGGTGGTSGTGDAGNSAASSATISANDFLTLLVTEMQNQDPTANTDPNEYINQLVQVNSLEQLIDINQNLSTALAPPSTGATTSAQAASSSASSQAAAAAAGLGGDAKTGAPTIVQPAAHPGSALGNVQSAAAAAYTASHAPVQGSGSKLAPGNLSVPEEKPAAHRVAHSLGARPHSR